MPDDYKIVARIVAEDASDSGAKSAERRLDQVERRGLSIGASLGRMFAALGGAYLFERLGRGLIGLNSEIQEANIGMATLFSGLTGMKMPDALRLARAEVKGLREDAAKGVGELSNYLRGYQMLMGPGLSGGATRQQLRDLTRSSLAAGFAMRGTAGLEQAPMDIVQALTGGVNDRQTPIALAALQAIGMTTGAFNKLDMKAKIETLTRAFGSFEGGVEMMGQTWSAQMSTIRDNLKELARTATEPLFARWNEHLRAANDWLTKHQDQLTRIAEVAGQKLVVMWDTLIERAGTYAALVGAAGAARMVAPAVPGGGGGLMGVARWLGSAVGLGEGAAGGASLAGIATALGSAAVVVGAVATGFLALKGALNEYPRILDEFRAAAMDLRDQMGPLSASLSHLWESVQGLAAEGSALNRFGALLAELGLIAVRGAAGIALLGASLLEVSAFVFDWLGVLSRWMTGAISTEGANQEVDALREGTFRRLAAMWNPVSAHEREVINILSEDKPIADGIPDVPNARGGNVTNVTGPVKIEIRVEKLDDPARVEVALGTIFQRLQANRRQARRLAIALP